MRWSRTDDRCFATAQKGGKSGLRRTGCWVTPSPGDGQESATENRPPALCGLGPRSQVRVKRRGKSSPVPPVTTGARQTPSGARSNRERLRVVRSSSRVDCSTSTVTSRLDEWSSSGRPRQGECRKQNPAYGLLQQPYRIPTSRIPSRTCSTPILCMHSVERHCRLKHGLHSRPTRMI